MTRFFGQFSFRRLFAMIVVCVCGAVAVTAFEKANANGVFGWRWMTLVFCLCCVDILCIQIYIYCDRIPRRTHKQNQKWYIVNSWDLLDFCHYPTVGTWISCFSLFPLRPSHLLYLTRRRNFYRKLFVCVGLLLTLFRTNEFRFHQFSKLR